MDRSYPPEIEYWYDVDDGITLEWFKNYLSEISSLSYENSAVRIEIWMRPSHTTRRVIVYSVEEALESAAIDWANIEETIITQSPGRVKQATLNHQHHYLRIRLENKSDESAETAIGDLRRKFKLSPSKPHPYKYRKSSLEFEVGRWNPKEFGAGIESIAKAIGPNPYLETAYVKSFDGDIERLTPFFTIESFLDFLNRRASTFGEVFVQLRARSMTVGISSPTDHKKLRIRTSMPPEDVDPLIDAWPSALNLKQVKSVDTGNFFTGSESAKNEDSKWIKLGVPIATAFITAFSVTSIVSLKKAIWPEQNLILVSPHQDGMSSTWIGNRLEVDWYLKPEQPSIREITKDAKANVRLTSEDGQSIVYSGEPPATFNVVAGTYNLAIDVDKLPTLRTQVKVVQSRKP